MRLGNSMKKITIRPRRQGFPYILGLALLALGLRHSYDELLGPTRTWIVLIVAGAFYLLGSELMHHLAHLTISREEVVCRSAFTNSAAIRDITEFVSETDRAIRFKTRLGRELIIDLSMFHKDQRLQARRLLHDRVPAYAAAT